MPELPDVEVWREYVDATALHRPVVGLGHGASGLRRTVPGRELERELVGRELASTRRHGRHLSVDVLGGGWLRLHFGMTGALRYCRRGGEPDHTRLRIDFENGFHPALQNTGKPGMIALLRDPDGRCPVCERSLESVKVSRRTSCFCPHRQAK